MRIDEITSIDASHIGPILHRAKALGFYGFGGACGEAAIAINRVLFAGQGTIVGAFNAAFLDRGWFVGHAGVLYDGWIWDGDGSPKHLGDIEEWGMLDVNNPDYAGRAKSAGIEWNEITAGSVEIVEFDSNEDALQHFGNGRLAGLEGILRQAVSTTAN